MHGDSQSIPPLIRFYRGDGTDAEGRTLDEILAWDDNLLEGVHDYIQWLFPNREPSMFNPFAPLLTDDDIAQFRRDPGLRAALLRSWQRMLTFYGFVWDGERVTRGPNFDSATRSWLHSGGHNLLRITRILKALTSLGCKREAHAFLLALAQVVQDHAGFSTSLRFWRSAVDED